MSYSIFPLFKSAYLFSPIEQAQHRGSRLRHRNSLSFSSASRTATSSLSKFPGSFSSGLENDKTVCIKKYFFL